MFLLSLSLFDHLDVLPALLPNVIPFAQRHVVVSECLVLADLSFHLSFFSTLMASFFQEFIVVVLAHGPQLSLVDIQVDVVDIDISALPNASRSFKISDLLVHFPDLGFLVDSFCNSLIYLFIELASH